MSWSRTMRVTSLSMSGKADEVRVEAIGAPLDTKAVWLCTPADAPRIGDDVVVTIAPKK